MAVFEIDGPYEISFEKRKGGRSLVFDEFWSDDARTAHLAGKCGCYVFAVRTGGGINPIYVGKATKTFKQEVFNPSNRHKYHNGFIEYGKGTPVMYFVVHGRSKGPDNKKHIAEIEGFLIQAGVAKNPSLQNVKGTQAPQWSIKGVIRNGSGKRSAVEGEFIKMFGIHR